MKTGKVKVCVCVGGGGGNSSLQNISSSLFAIMLHVPTSDLQKRILLKKEMWGRSLPQKKKTGSTLSSANDH